MKFLDVIRKAKVRVLDFDRQIDHMVSRVRIALPDKYYGLAKKIVSDPQADLYRNIPVQLDGNVEKILGRKPHRGDEDGLHSFPAFPIGNQYYLGEMLQQTSVLWRADKPIDHISAWPDRRVQYAMVKYLYDHEVVFHQSLDCDEFAEYAITVLSLLQKQRGLHIKHIKLMEVIWRVPGRYLVDRYSGHHVALFFDAGGNSWHHVSNWGIRGPFGTQREAWESVFFEGGGSRLMFVFLRNEDGVWKRKY